jgi:hypothetical protein
MKRFNNEILKYLLVETMENVALLTSKNQEQELHNNKFRYVIMKHGRRRTI